MDRSKVSEFEISPVTIPQDRAEFFEDPIAMGVIEMYRLLHPYLDTKVPTALQKVLDRYSTYDVNIAHEPQNPDNMFGFVSTDNQTDEDRLMIHELAVVRRMRRKNIGSALLDHVASEAQRQNLHEVIVRPNPEAMGFYKNNGFEITDPSEGIMQLDIKNKGKILSKQYYGKGY